MPSYGASRTQLGQSIGSLAASLLSGSGSQAGMLDGYKQLLYKNQADKAGLEAEQLRREQSRDPGLEAAGEMGFVGEDAKRFNDAITTGSYDQDPVAYNPDGSTDFSRSGPAAQQFDPKQIHLGAILKNTLSRGGKADDLAKGLSQAHRNYLGYQVTPENAADVGAMVGATEGKPLEGVKAQLMSKIAAGGGTDVVRALLAAAGKGQFDNMPGGVFNVDTGDQDLNGIGTSAAAENNAQASQARAGAMENLAQADLYQAKQHAPSGVNVSQKPVKLQSLPIKTKQGYVENSTAIKKIDDAIAEAEKNKDAFGLKNMLGDTVNQRLFPESTKARAKIAEIGAVKIHDLTGSAQGVQEVARTKPFVPNVDDTPEAIIDKLKNLRGQYESINEEMAFAYPVDEYNGGFDLPPPKSTGNGKLNVDIKTWKQIPIDQKRKVWEDYGAEQQAQGDQASQTENDPFAGFTPEQKAQFLQEHPDWNQ